MAKQADHPGYIADKDKIKNRLHRIAGQVGGLERMVDEERYCIDILTQVSAAQAALDRVALAILSEHTRHCVVGAEKLADREELTDEMLGAVGRLLRSR